MIHTPKHFKEKTDYKTPFHVYIVYLVVCCMIVTATSFSKLYSTTDTLSRYSTTEYAFDEATVMFLDMTATSNGSASVNLFFDTNQESTSSQVVPFVVNNIGGVSFVYDVTISVTTFPSYSANGPGMTITYNSSSFSPTTSTKSKIYSSVGTIDAGQSSATQNITFALNRSVPYTQSNIAATIEVVARMT